MIKYRTRDDNIEAHEVLRETAKMMVLAPGTSANQWRQERKVAKRSEWENWHDTWDEAKTFLIEDAQNEVDASRSRLERSKSRLGNIKGMVPPHGEL
jgi:hypothetical protein